MIASIYKLTDNNNYVYYGSTTRHQKRLSEHKCGSRSMSELMDKDSLKMEILEEYYFDVDTYNKKFILNRERYYIENFDCINYLVPGQTHKEYREKHKEEKKQYNKEYREKHKDKVKDYREKHREETKDYNKEYREKHKQKMNEKFDCPCGGKYTKASKSIHQKTAKHLKYINTSST